MTSEVGSKRTFLPITFKWVYGVDPEKEKGDLQIVLEKERRTEMDRNTDKTQRKNEKKRRGRPKLHRKQHFSFLILYVWFQPAWHQQQ